MATHLVIGDPHCTPKANNDRFLWAGRVAADYKVSHVILYINAKYYLY